MTRVLLEPDTNSVVARHAHALGYLWLLLAASPVHQFRPFATLGPFYDKAIRHDQVALFFNDQSEPVAFFIFARLSQRTERRIIETGVIDLHESEWSGGDKLWILDCVVRPGYLKAVLRSDMVAQLPPDVAIGYVDYRRNRMALKLLNLAAFARKVSKLL